MATHAIQRHKLWSINTPPLILFLVSILLGALAGCGGGGGGSSDSESAPDLSPDPAPTPAPGPQSWTLSATAGTGGSIDPGAATVEHGATFTFMVTPEVGYSIEQVVGCGGTLDGDTYTTGVITGACTVESTFLRNTYTLSATAGTGGSIDPGAATVEHGATFTFMVTPGVGYSIEQVVGCGGALDGDTYTTGVVTEACEVSASFHFSLSAPGNLQAFPGDREVFLQWTDIDGVDAYTLYYATEGGIQPENFGIWVSQHDGVIVEDVTSPHTVEGLNNGTEYFFAVTASVGGQESKPSDEVSAVPVESPVVTGRLNDTGIDWCADGDTNNRTCPVSGYPGQDGEFGRDAAARVGTLEKTGSGDAGFDFTKIANNGSELPAWAALGDGPNDWGCTRDNVTGLIWEVKTTDGGLRDRDNTYTWYEPNIPNRGAPGTQNGGSCEGSFCDTYHFARVVNEEGLCGATDWRLPTLAELHSIAHHARTEPAVDVDFFPNMLPSSYWSSSVTWVANAWGVNFSNASSASLIKGFTGGFVRLVRGSE